MNQDEMRKWALLIGINKYPKLSARSQLAGCVNDVKLMSSILQGKFGFPKENITLLEDEQASQQSILEAMENLIKTVGKDDIVVIHYSGHGSQMTDREGDEPDGYDETIVPSDSGRPPKNENRDITDDQIYENLLKISKSTPYITLIFDSCHSGTMARDAFGANSRWVEPDKRPVAELPLSTVDTTLAKQSRRELGPSGWLPLGQRYVLISGCRDEESSLEYEVHDKNKTLTHGTLTYFLGQELVRAGPGTTYRDIFERVSSQVNAAHSSQHPQMEGARDRELFDIHEIEPMRFVSVQRRIDNEVTLGAGAAHGMTVSSQWTVHPQETKRVTDETSRLGLVEITEVHSITSKGKILEEMSQCIITEGTRAVEYAHSYGEMRLVIDVQAPPSYEKNADELKELTKNSDLLRLASENEAADARVYIVPPRSDVKRGDPVPQLSCVGEAMWAVVRDGRLMMPLHPVSEAAATIELRNNLEKDIRYRQALALHNPNDDSALKDKVEFILKQQAVDGRWEEAKPEENSGLIVFEEGERIAAEIINNSKSPVYVTVLDFGLTRGIEQFYPIQGASEQLPAGKSIEIGMREGDEPYLEIPEDFPYLPDPNDKESNGGTETLKLFVTSHESDFSMLVQEGFRRIVSRKFIGSDMPLNQLLDMALTGHGTRDTKRNRLPNNEEWTTVERTFYLRRKML
jgi:hypothetical protein